MGMSMCHQLLLPPFCFMDAQGLHAPGAPEHAWLGVMLCAAAAHEHILQACMWVSALVVLLVHCKRVHEFRGSWVLVGEMPWPLCAGTLCNEHCRHTTCCYETRLSRLTWMCGHLHLCTCLATLCLTWRDGSAQARTACVPPSPHPLNPPHPLVSGPTPTLGGRKPRANQAHQHHSRHAPARTHWAMCA